MFTSSSFYWVSLFLLFPWSLLLFLWLLYYLLKFPDFSPSPLSLLSPLGLSPPSLWAGLLSPPSLLGPPLELLYLLFPPSLLLSLLLYLLLLLSCYYLDLATGFFTVVHSSSWATSYYYSFYSPFYSYSSLSWWCLSPLFFLYQYFLLLLLLLLLLQFLYYN